jgi:hypothetical protein
VIPNRRESATVIAGLRLSGRRMALNLAGLEAKQVPLLIRSDDQAKQSRRLPEPQRRLNKERSLLVVDTMLR